MRYLRPQTGPSLMEPWYLQNTLKRFITPALDRIVHYCHSRGIPSLTHTDRNIWGMFESRVKTGVDGVHPIDPLAGMDPGEAKVEYGHQ